MGTKAEVEEVSGIVRRTDLPFRVVRWARAGAERLGPTFGSRLPAVPE
jgi:hypothetical protein